jgi:hypothetical protein
MISPSLCSTLSVKHADKCHFRYFDINGRLLRVGSQARELLDSLESFFHPYIDSYDDTSDADRFYELTAISDPALFDVIKANLSASPDDLLTTNLKHDLEYRLRCFFSASGEVTVIEDEPLKIFYVVFAGRTEIVGTNGSRMRTGLLRAIRGAWMNDQPGLIVHSCVLEKNGKGIVIAGDKYSGKTTSLLKLCTQKQYNLVANDRCLLQFDESSSLRALGVPTVVNLRARTIKPFPDLQYLKTHDLLGIVDLARALSVDVKSEVEVKALVFLAYDRACEQPSYRRLSDEEKWGMLSSHLFSDREYEWVKLLKIGRVLSHAGNRANNVRVSDVPAFQLTSNENQLDERARLLDSWCQEKR